ncbi:GDSL-type esterase/lipase family protein [Sapientia aquatica]|uniref:CBM-cenC domain-containing protein n=1 Tax=Sapientia aquatica TaxID=1549640 RepID=A0A4R5VRW2_9BURK|nr:GDSL-type esterase/lipase family protein [Sapientia aquatica]TDK60442.1 hypothetical protein E2I14_18130 [Sapientia aquatica]
MKFNHLVASVGTVFLTLSACCWNNAIAAPTSYAPDNPNIQYMGRVDFSAPTAPVLGWANTSITVNLNGTAIRGTFSDSTGKDFLQVMVDGVVTPTIIQPPKGKTVTYTLASGLAPGAHTVVLFKRTEFWGVVTFTGFSVDGTLLAPPARPTRRIEFYGDSNVSAHDSEDIYDLGYAKSNDAWFGYAGITARMLNAEHQNLGWGGAGMTGLSNPLVQNVWNLLRPDDLTVTYDFSQFPADVIVINAGSNDSNQGDNRANVIPAWEDLIMNRIRKVHPGAHVVLADSWGWSANEPANYLSIAVADMKSKGETNVSWVSWPWLWSQNHAVIEEHGGFANVLAAHIATQMGWAAPTPNTISSFAGTGLISNTGFEIVPIGQRRTAEAAGWRQWAFGNSASGTVVSGSGAHSGSRYAQLTVGGDKSNEAGFWQATPVTVGKTYTVNGFARRASGSGATVSMRVEFKDENQSIISSSVGLINPTGSWGQYCSSLVAPAGAWSVNVVLQLDGVNTVIQFDDVVLSSQ